MKELTDKFSPDSNLVPTKQECVELTDATNTCMDTFRLALMEANDCVVRLVPEDRWVIHPSSGVDTSKFEDLI